MERKHTTGEIIGYLKSVSKLYGTNNNKGNLCQEAAELIERLTKENKNLYEALTKSNII